MDKVTLASEAASGPSSQELLEKEFGKRRKGVVFAVLGGLVVLAAGGGAFAYLQRQAKARAANEAWGELAQCLVGPEGLTEATPSLAFRRQQLAAMTLPEPERGVIDGAAWPKRCGKSALRLIVCVRPIASLRDAAPARMTARGGATDGEAVTRGLDEARS